MLKDLDDLVRAGIISSDTAEQISRYYQSKKDSSGNRFNTLLGILGALLVSAGIVLVVAHNWDNLGKGLKTFFAFLPMVIGQVLCGYTLLRKNDSVLWRESSSVFLFFAMAAGISLISQVYQVSGSLDGFVLTWLLVTAPLVYVMKSSVTSLMVIAAATWYGFLVGYDSGDRVGFHSIPWYYLAFLLFLAPHYYWYARHKRQSLFFHFHNWFLAVSVIINLGTVNSMLFMQWGSAVYMALFGMYYVLGNTPFFKRMHIVSNPFFITGLLGMVIVLTAWSFDTLWDDVFSRGPGGGGGAFAGFYLESFQVVLWVLLITTIALMIYNYRKEKTFVVDPAGFSAFIFLACILINRDDLCQFIINCWILLIGLFYIRKGSRQNHFGVLNLGLVIVLALAVVRFFDDSIPFIWRGVFFVIAGAGFFAANYLLLRKNKAVAQKNNV
jgi:uncharacterized membrane protein